MSIVSIVLLGVVIALASVLISIAAGRSAARSVVKEEQPSRPCYRCGIVATHDYMGLYYCRICRDVVAATIAVVQHDPPYGYPGQTGYLEFPKKEEVG